MLLLRARCLPALPDFKLKSALPPKQQYRIVFSLIKLPALSATISTCSHVNSYSSATRSLARLAASLTSWRQRSATVLAGWR